MNDFQKNISGRDKIPKEHLTVDQIEKDKKEKEGYSHLPPNEQAKSYIFAGVLVVFKKILSFFTPKGRTAGALVTKQQIFEDLLSFKRLLQTLQIDDQSHNPEFTKQLTEYWNNILEDSPGINQFEKTAAREPSKLKILIDSIDNYPPNVDHTLGFYLTQYAGKEWLPFPFMDILHELHLQHQENPLSSQLYDWVAILNELLTALDIKADLDT